MICHCPINEGDFNWYSKRKARSNGWVKEVAPAEVIDDTIQRESNGFCYINGPFIIPFEYLGRI